MAQREGESSDLRLLDASEFVKSSGLELSKSAYAIIGVFLDK